jgi:hypothetical protein
MAKKKSKTTASGPENMPALTKEQSQIIQALMKELIAQELNESWPVPVPVNVTLWKQDERLAASFSFAHATELNSSSYQFAVPMTLKVAQDAVARGQEAIWEWLRDASAWICTSAVAQDLEMPGLIFLQISDVIRYYEADKDEEFAVRIHEAAKNLAMSTAMGACISD